MIEGVPEYIWGGFIRGRLRETFAEAVCQPKGSFKPTFTKGASLLVGFCLFRAKKVVIK